MGILHLACRIMLDLEIGNKIQSWWQRLEWIKSDLEVQR